MTRPATGADAPTQAPADHPATPSPAPGPPDPAASAEGAATDACPRPGPAPGPPLPDPAAAATGTGRDAILRAARRAFTLRPYAEVTLRGIAAAAGVSPSLIVKRFGTKEDLFNAVADFRPAADLLLAAPLNRLGRHLVLTLVDIRQRQADPLLRVIFTLGNTEQRSPLRENFRAQVTIRLTDLLEGADRPLRAELVVGLLLGLGATLSIHRPGAGNASPPERLADLYAPALQRLITPDGDDPRPPAGRG